MIKNIVVVGDLHLGSRYAMLPPKVCLDNLQVVATKLNAEIYKRWLYFWKEYVPKETKGEKYVVVINGDIIDGCHHGSKSQITQILSEQQDIAIDILKAVMKNKSATAIYFVAGTPAHSGEQAETEKGIARALDGVPDQQGILVRQELWLELAEKYLCNFMHHISTVDSSAAVEKELMLLISEAGRWNNRIPDVVIRSHRHSATGVWKPTYHGRATSYTLPSFQAPTDFVKRISGGRTSTGQIGGAIIRSNNDNPYILDKIWSLSRPKMEVG